MFENYVALTKPGIIMGNLVATCSGVFFASQGNVNWLLLVCVAFGSSCVVASGCVFNNYVDRDIDSKMQRTKSRGFVLNTVHVPKSLIFATIIGLLGVTVLHIFANWYAVFFAVFGFFVYVCLYTLKYKRNSVHGTLIGSASGACPPVIGYVAVTNGLDWPAFLLFAIYCVWQLPHSYAIAVYRHNDYKSAGIPVLPVVRGFESARRQSIAYISVYACLVCLMCFLGYTNLFYLVFMLPACLYWLYLAFNHKKTDDKERWGKKVFLMSISLVMLFSMMISTAYTKREIVPFEASFVDVY